MKTPGRPIAVSDRQAEAAARSIEIGSATPGACARILGVQVRTLKHAFQRLGWRLVKVDQRWRVIGFECKELLAATNGHDARSREDAEGA